MPIYEFACKSCGHSFETRVARVGARPDACPSCGAGDLDKLMSSFAALAASPSQAAAARDVSPCSMGEACGRLTGRCAN